MRAFLTLPLPKNPIREISDPCAPYIMVTDFVLALKHRSNLLQRDSGMEHLPFQRLCEVGDNGSQTGFRQKGPVYVRKPRRIPPPRKASGHKTSAKRSRAVSRRLRDESGHEASHEALLVKLEIRRQTRKAGTQAGP